MTGLEKGGRSAISPSQAASLRMFIRHLHSVTAKDVNRQDATRGRQVWFEYWETQLTFEKSWLARLNYVHRNAVHHGLVRLPEEYEWCSAGWFQRKAHISFYKTVMAFPCDRIKIPDAFPVDPADLGKP